MVRIINIDTKTRTIRVSNADGDIKTWRTTESGTHFPIREGQTTKEGLQEFLKKHVVVGRVPDAPAKKDMGAEQLERLEKKGKGWGKEQMSVLRELGKTNPKGLKDELDRMETDEYKFGKPAEKDDYDRKFAHEIKKDDIVSAGGKDYKIIQADRNWVIGLDDKGNRLKINPELSFDAFKVKKSAKSGPDKNEDISNWPFNKVMELPDDDPRLEKYLKAHHAKWKAAKDEQKIEALKDKVVSGIAGDVGSQDYTQLVSSELEKELAQEPAKSGPDKNADVSDIITDYKKKMKALGPGASIRKTDRVEADAIKEFMTRKLGANRPYDDYYNYWLSGMDKATKDAFNEIYNESEAREMAFSELASDVDHSGMARGEPTYDELEQWSQKQKAKKAQQQPAKRDIENIPISQLTPAERKILWDREQERYEATQKDIAKDTIKGLSGMVAKTEKLIESAKKTGTQEDVDDLTKYRDELKQSIKELSEIHGFSKKEPKPAEKKEAPKPAKKERNWWRGPREDEDAYFNRRDKTLAEARKIDKVSEWYQKAYAGDDAFPKNKDITFQQMSDDLLSGKMTDFYETVGVGESDVREKLFTELTERTGRPYDDFYLSWLYGGLENAQKEARGTKFRKDPKLGLTTGRPTKK